MIDVDTLPACPVETTLTLISDKWKILIVRDLLTGTKRFSELRRSIGHISQKVLTSNLRQMEADGLVHREVYPEVPPRVEYSLTDTGHSLKPSSTLYGIGEKTTRPSSPPDTPPDTPLNAVKCNREPRIRVGRRYKSCHIAVASHY